MKKRARFLLLLYAVINISKAQDVIDNVALAFQNISNQKIEKDSYPLLGPQLLGKKYKNETIIVDSDAERNIYQIRVIDQTLIKNGGGHCGFHSQRNVLYIVDMIKSPFKEFDSLYKQMLNKDKFLEWNKAVRKVTKSGLEECSGAVISQSDLQEIAKEAPDAFPKNMDTTKIVHGNLIFYKDTVEDFTEQIKKYESMSDVNDIQKNAHAFVLYEKIVPNDAIIMDNFIMPIKIDVLPEEDGHGVTLVIHKYNKRVEYLFADSWKNQKFSTAFNGLFNDIIGAFVDLFALRRP